ncbi:hypothetical protein RSAG8_05169, partial [Rhizoctonia solani AG-8 WAC10335]
MRLQDASRNGTGCPHGTKWWLDGWSRPNGGHSARAPGSQSAEASLSTDYCRSPTRCKPRYNNTIRLTTFNCVLYAHLVCGSKRRRVSAESDR